MVFTMLRSLAPPSLWSWASFHKWSKTFLEGVDIVDDDDVGLDVALVDRFWRF